MLRSAPPKIKHGARSCLGLGDVFLITKENDSAVVAKYKALATSERARADENAEEISELRDMLAGINAGSNEMEELRKALEDRSGKLREAEEGRRAAQTAAQAAIEEALQDAASLREKLAKVEQELEAERKRCALANAQLAEERASKAAVASGSEAAAAMVAKLQAELSEAQTALNEEKVRNKAANKQLEQVQAKLTDEAAARAALTSLAEQQQKIAEAQKADIIKLQDQIIKLKKDLNDAMTARTDGMATASALANLQKELDWAKADAKVEAANLSAELATEKAAHGATEEARKNAMAELAQLRALTAGDPRKKLSEAQKRVQDAMKNKRIAFDGAGVKSTQQSPKGVPQAWSVDSLDSGKKRDNNKVLDTLAGILKDYPELYCECHGCTDADASKPPEPGLAAFFKLNSTQQIQDELARNRALACVDGLVARGVPSEQLIVTWKGCGSDSKVDFIPILPSDATEKLRAEVAMLRNLLAKHAADDPNARASEAVARVKDLLNGNYIQFDGAGAKSTQQSPMGVPQAWNLDSLDDGKKTVNSKTLDLIAAILKDYPELYCKLHGSTDADPSKLPDEVLAAYFGLSSTQPIQDELARNRALACKTGLVARGVPSPQLVVTWKGCGTESKVDFVPMVPEKAVEEVRGKYFRLRDAAKLDAVEASLLKDQVATLTNELAALQAALDAKTKNGDADHQELAKLRSALANAQAALANSQGNDPNQKAIDATKRMQEVLAGHWIQFDGAGNKSTQNSPKGVPQAWDIESLDANKTALNFKTLDMIAAVLKDYPELYCECAGQTDADPSKVPDAGLAKYFDLDTTQPIQDKLAKNRALACKAGLVARGIPPGQLIVTWKGCTGQSKVDFKPLSAPGALTIVSELMLREETTYEAEIAALKAEIKRLKALIEQLRVELETRTTKIVKSPSSGARSLDDFGVLRVTVLSASDLKAADRQGTSDPYAKLYLGDHLHHRTTVVKESLDPEWNENFEYHGVLRELLQHNLEIHLFDHDAVSINDELGKAVFDISEVAQANFETSSTLSIQGTVSVKLSWAPAKLVKTGDMFMKHKGDIVAHMGKYVKHQFSLWLAQCIGDGGWTEWKSYRITYHDKNEIEYGATVLGVADATLSRYEFSVVTLEHGFWSMRCESSKEYKEWTTVIGQIEDPKLTFHRMQSTKDYRKTSNANLNISFSRSKSDMKNSPNKRPSK